jgi:hypothetical protein
MNDREIDNREKQLTQRLERVEELEKEVFQRENALKRKESARKQVLLRLAPSLWSQIAAWAEEDMRSINGQIEYLLSQAVKNRGR